MSKFLDAINHLSSWFDRQKRILPWREDPSVYRVWVSEIMLQQTQVATVVPYFEKFIHRFPTVEILAEASIEEVLFYWAGLGYYSRARNLHRAAQEIVQRGRFPRTREEWLEIPGVGNYTAGAILSIAYNFPEAILDGNVERVLSRVRRVTRDRGDAVFKQRLWRLAQFFVDTAHKNEISPSVLNQALMELGARICTPKKPQCSICPLQSICRAEQHGNPESYPPRKKPKEWIRVLETPHCVLDDQGQVLLRQSLHGEWRAGLWDFPLDRPESNLEYLGEIETNHTVTRHKVKRLTKVWRMNQKLDNKLWQAREEDAFLKWVPLHNPTVAIGSAVKKILKEVDQKLGLIDPKR